MSYKINIGKYDIHELRYYLNTYFELKMGVTSELNEKLKEEGLITSSIDIDIMNADKHLLVVLLFESKEYEKVIKMIEEELSVSNVFEKDLNRKKKVMKSSCVFRSDSIYSVASKINSNMINYRRVILDEYELIDKLNIKIVDASQILFKMQEKVILEKAKQDKIPIYIYVISFIFARGILNSTSSV